MVCATAIEDSGTANESKLRPLAVASAEQDLENIVTQCDSTLSLPADCTNSLRFQHPHFSSVIEVTALLQTKPA